MSLYWQMPVGKDVTLTHEAQSITRELSKKKEKKRTQKRLPKHEPFKFKKQKLNQKYKSTKPLDARYSDQRKLRRMYRNS